VNVGHAGALWKSRAQEPTICGMFYPLLIRGVALAAATGPIAVPPAPGPQPLGAPMPAAAAQEGAGARPTPERDAQDEDPPLLASDGKPALPGRIPSDTPEATREAWTELVDTLTIARPEPASEAPFSFEIAAAVRHRDEETGSQDFLGRVAYYDGPVGYVSLTTLDDDGRVVSVEMRGPDPDRPQLTRRLEYWFRKDRGEGATDGWISLAGADFTSSRDKIDEIAVASFDIARILTPPTMRLTSLRRLRADGYDPASRVLALGDDPGVVFPDVDVLGVQAGGAQKIAELAAGLTWYEVRTPDFRLFEKGLSRAQRQRLRQQVKRVVVGVAPRAEGEGAPPGAGRPQLVLVSPRAEGPLQAPGALLMQCTEWFAQQADPAVVLPGRFYAYETVEDAASPTGFAFAGRTTADLFLLEGCKVGADLTPQSFVPER